jgi:hypothetical protein
MSPLHLTASMRVIKAHEGGRATIAWAKHRIAEAAAAPEKSPGKGCFGPRPGLT